MSANALPRPSDRAPLARLHPRALGAAEGDRWTEVVTIEAAAEALGRSPAGFLTMGACSSRLRDGAAASLFGARDRPARRHDALPHSMLILARGPFALDDERR